MKDHVKSSDRLYFRQATNEDFYYRECCGCGRDSNQIVIEDEITYEDLEWSSKETDCGMWYCHADCYRDSHL